MKEKGKWLLVLAATSVIWFAAGYDSAAPDGRPVYAILRFNRQTGLLEVAGWPLVSERRARQWIREEGRTGTIYHVARLCSESGLRGGGEEGRQELTGTKGRGLWEAFPGARNGLPGGASSRLSQGDNPQDEGGASSRWRD